MQQEMKVKFVGTSPLLMHNGMLADKENPIAAEIAQRVATKGRDRSDQIVKEIEWFSWLGGLWLNNKNQIAIPSDAIEKCIIEGARKTKNGKMVESGVNANGWSLLEFKDAGKTLEEIYALGEYVDNRLVKSNPAAKTSGKVMRTRPIFNSWSFSCVLLYDDRIVPNQDSLMRWVEIAGIQVGIGDYRPKFGRFEAIVV